MTHTRRIGMRSKAALRFRFAVSSASRRAAPAPVSSGGASLAATIGGQLVRARVVRDSGVLAKSVIHGVYLVVGSE